MPAYCVIANCNNRRRPQVLYEHELPRSRPAVRRKWIKFIQFKRADFLAAPYHAHLCSEHFSECDFEADTMFRYSFKILPDACILVGLSGKVSVSSSELQLAILQRLLRGT